MSLRGALALVSVLVLVGGGLVLKIVAAKQVMRERGITAVHAYVTNTLPATGRLRWIVIVIGWALVGFTALAGSCLAGP
jgi:hypothetical protein